jgi:hypothetical protein
MSELEAFSACKYLLKYVTDTFGPLWKVYMNVCTIFSKTHDSSVGEVTGEPGFNFKHGYFGISQPNHIQNSSEAHPVSYPMGARGSSSEVKQQ